MSATCNRCKESTGPGMRGRASYCRTCEKVVVTEALRGYMAEKGWAPSARELQRITGMGSAAVQRILHGLRADGVIDWRDGLCRTLHFVESK